MKSISYSPSLLQLSLLTLGTVPLMPASARAAVINVPADQPTIQAGIDAAVDGDEVVVAPGEYFENIQNVGKLIIIRSASGDPSDTIINGGGTARCVLITGGGAGVSFEGFTLTGGHESDNSGGGVWLDASAGLITISNCAIVDNFAHIHGGGVYIAGQFGCRFTDCLFSGNTTNLPVGGAGGAAFSLSVGAPTHEFTDCTFNGNSSSNAGAISAQLGSAKLAVDNCVFSGNSASFGGAVMIAETEATFDACTFSGNSTTNIGGALYSDDGGLTVTDCIFAGNSANVGGALSINSGELAVRQCVFSGNTAAAVGGAVNLSEAKATFEACTLSQNFAAADGGGVFVFGDFLTEGYAHIADSLLWGNSNGDLALTSSAKAALVRSVAAVVNFDPFSDAFIGVEIWNFDPLFVDPDGADDILGTPDDDLRLQEGSPAIDLIPWTELDLDGNSRVAGDSQDPGAYEFGSLPPVESCPSDLDGDNVIGFSDLLQLLVDWGECE